MTCLPQIPRRPALCSKRMGETCLDKLNTKEADRERQRKMMRPRRRSEWWRSQPLDDFVEPMWGCELRWIECCTVEFGVVRVGRGFQQMVYSVAMLECLILQERI